MYRITRTIGMALLACVWTASPGQAEETADEPFTFDWGFMASRQQDLHGVMRFRMLGPLIEWSDDDEGRTLRAVRPFHSYSSDPLLERARHETLWPVATQKTFRHESGGRVLLALWHNFDTDDPSARYRFWIFPLYFQGRDIHGDSYAALFPVGGRIHEFLGRDRITFALFPVYLRTELMDVPTQNWFWPIYSKTEGRGIYRFRVFPFYGQSRHRDRYSKRFVMWPIWTSAEYHYQGSSGTGYILFPLYGRIMLDDQRTWSVLPPFFRYSRGDRINHILAPWPFVRIQSGEVNQRYFWPIYGQKEMRGVHSRFFLWPFMHEDRVDRGDRIGRRFIFLPFYYSDVHRLRTAHPDDEAGEVVHRYQKIWPLFSYLRDGEDVRLRTLDLWPLKNTPPIERNYAPLWTLFSHVRSSEASDTELLWGLYRRQVRDEGAERHTSIFPLVEWGRAEEERSWAILKGLIGFERQGSVRRFQLLYLMRWGGHEENGL